MEQLICKKCGGELEESNNGLFRCPFCGLKYQLGQDEQGIALYFRVLERKKISGGQIAYKTERTELEPIAKRTATPHETIAAVIADASELTSAEALKTIASHLEQRKFDLAHRLIEEFLQKDPLCAQVLWAKMLCERKIPQDTSPEFSRLLKNFTDEDGKTLDTVLSNSDPQFAAKIIRRFFDTGFVEDASAKVILTTIVPFMYDPSVLSAEELNRRLATAFDDAIEHHCEQAFTYLLRTLEPEAVEQYIDYNLRFAERFAGDARKYYRDVLSVDAGHREALFRIVCADIGAADDLGVACDDLEKLLRYAANVEKEISDVAEEILGQRPLTVFHSNFFWELLRYSAREPQSWKNTHMLFAKALLQNGIFPQAAEFYSLVISYDPKNADAFFGLACARIKARDENGIAKCKLLLEDCPEFNKCIALCLERGDTARKDKLYALADGQKKRIEQTKDSRKRRMRFAMLCIGVGVVIIAAIVAIVSCGIINSKREKLTYSRNYSLDNLEIDIIKKTCTNATYYNDNYTLALDVKLTNLSEVDIARVTGSLAVYLGEDTQLNTWSCDWKNSASGVLVEAGQTVTQAVTFKSSGTDMRMFYSSDLEELKLVFTLKGLTYVTDKGKATTIEGEREITAKEYDPEAAALKTAAYSPDTFGMRITSMKRSIDSAYYYTEYTVVFGFEIENRSTANVSYINGTVAIYLGETDLLYRGDWNSPGSTASYVDAGDTVTGELEYYGRDETMATLYSSKLDELKIVFTLKYITFVTDSDAERDVECERVLTIKKFEPEVLAERLAAEYAEAEELLSQKRYAEAYSAFLDLGSYRDAQSRAQEAQDLAIEFAWSLADTGDYLGAGAALTGIGLPENDERIVAFRYASEGKFSDAAKHGLKKIVFSRGTTEIAERVLYNCDKVEEIVLPDSVERVDADAFSGCGRLRSIGFSSQLKYIGSRAFNGCYSLLSVTLPSSLLSIGEDAFKGCSKLIEVRNFSTLQLTLGSNLYGYVAKYAKEILQGDAGTSRLIAQDDYIFYVGAEEVFLMAYYGSQTTLQLPASYNGRSYAIYDYAFAATDMTAVSTGGATSIGAYAFSDGALRELVCEESLKTIGDYAFYNNSTIATVTMKSVESIGDRAFYQCRYLTSVTLSEKLRTIGSSAFYYCSALTVIGIPASVVSIGSYAFQYCSSLEHAILGNPSGWSATSYNTHQLDEKELSDPATVAGYLVNKYCSYTWERSE